MLSLKGYYEGGQVYFTDTPPIVEKTEVIVTFLADEREKPKKPRVPGGLRGRMHIPDDFNDPIEDLKDYM